MEKLLKNYVDVQKAIDTLESTKESIREEIARELPPEGIENDFLNAYWQTRKKWTYSPKVERLTSALKVEKALEEQSGLAKFEEKKELNIRINKKQND